MAPDPRKYLVVATFVSPGVAAGAGGFVIVNGKIHKVPPRGPLEALQAALSLTAASEHLSASLKGEIASVTNRVLQESVAQIGE